MVRASPGQDPHEPPDRAKRPPLALVCADLAAPALVLLAPIVAFLSYHRYGLLDPGAIALILTTALFGLLLGFLVVLIGPIMRVVVLGTALTLSIENSYEVISGSWLLPIAFLALWAIRTHAATIVAVTFLVLIVSTIIVPPTNADLVPELQTESSPDSRSDLPPIIHLVLDEHIGIEGIPSDLPLGAKIKEDLKSFYDEFDFRLYGMAFSPYYTTAESLSNMLNFSASDIHQFWRNASSLRRNKYFSLLSERGYKFRIYQTDFLDFCQTPEFNLELCVTYAINSIKSIESLRLNTMEKARFLFHNFESTSYRLEWARRHYGSTRKSLARYGISLPRWPRGVDAVGPLGTLPIFERLNKDLSTLSRGTVYFAHVMIPHYPYVLKEDCRAREHVSDWLTRTSPVAKAPASNTAQTRAERYGHYFQQMECQQTLLRDLFGTLQSADGYADAIIVVHGDHGSRIVMHHPTPENNDHLTETDYVDGFSVLFAAKAPNLAAGYDEERTPLPKLLANMFIPSVAVDIPDVVFLVSDDAKAKSRMMSRPMLDSW